MGGGCEPGTQQGTGQITTFNQLGFTNHSLKTHKPDGWYLPADLDTAIILETKSSQEPVTHQPWVEELLKNCAVVMSKYRNVIGILYNGSETNVFINGDPISASTSLQHKSYYLDLVQDRDLVEIENVRYRYEPGEDWTAVPKPWRSKDAYLIGNGNDENYRITLAPHGETNNKIEKADVVYQLTDNGQWTDETNVAIVGYAPRPIEYGPTFEVSSLTAKRLLHDQDVLDVQLDESDLDFLKSIVQPLDR
jgi:hypothetical protein